MLSIGIGISVVLDQGALGGAGAPPTLVSLNVTSGSTLGGTVVTGTGTNLTGVSAVTVGGVAATSISSTGTTVTFTTPAGSAGAATVIATVTAGTATLTNGFTYVVLVAPVLESISRDIGVAAGGTAQTLRGYGFTGTSGVTFGGAAATSVVVVNDSKVTCVTPSGTASETAVDVVVTNAGGSSTLSAAFEYGPTVTVTYASETFASGSLGALSSTGSVSVVTIPTPRGSATKCAQCTTTSGGTESSVSIALTNNPMVNQPNGLWVRHYPNVPTATMTLVESAGQVKTFLCRVNNTTPLTAMFGVGTQFGGAGTQLATYIDSGITPVVGSVPGVPQGDGDWPEYLIQITRNTGASTGRMRIWVNGKKTVNTTNAAIAGNTTTDTYTPRLGAVFTQATPAGTLTINVADVQVLNGYAEPLEP